VASEARASVTPTWRSIYQQLGREEEARAETAQLRSAPPNFTARSFTDMQFRKSIAEVEADAACLRAAGLPD
jgi:hypothetical protein